MENQFFYLIIWHYLEADYQATLANKHYFNWFVWNHIVIEVDSFFMLTRWAIGNSGLVSESPMSLFFLHTFILPQLTPVFIFTVKVVLSIFILITIRGGVPRYRYDFLTKLGWIKFLTLVIIIFCYTLVLRLCS